MTDPRIDELNDYAAAEGFTLAIPAAAICALEDAGHLVNLRTGEIQYNALEAFLNTRLQLTQRGWELYDALRNGAAVTATATEDAGEVQP
jgi:hypothetical protein